MSGIILHISAGQGPAECEWVVAKLADAFGREAARDGLTCVAVEPFDGPCPSILLRVDGAGAEAFVAARAGTVRWIGTSTFRPTHKRKNWFVGVNRVSEVENTPDLQERDIVYQTMRASGPGGPARQQDRECHSRDACAERPDDGVARSTLAARQQEGGAVEAGADAARAAGARGRRRQVGAVGAEPSAGTRQRRSHV